MKYLSKLQQAGKHLSDASEATMRNDSQQNRVEVMNALAEIRMWSGAMLSEWDQVAIDGMARQIAKEEGFF